MNNLPCRACLGVVVYRHAEDVRALLESLMPYTRAQHLPVLVLNNDPTQPDFLQPFLADFPEIIPFQAEENLGYAGGNQYLWEKAQAYGAEFFVLLTQDIVVKPEGLEALLQAMEADATLAQGAGYLLQEESPMRADSFGMVVDKSGRFRDAFSGQQVEAFVEPGRDFFGVTGAMFVIRNEVVRRVLRGELFPSFFWMYKEDIDLAWRLREEGQTIKLFPICMGLHGRTLAEKQGFWARARDVWGRDSRLAYASYRNQLLLWRDRLWSVLPDFSLPQALLWELKRGLFMLFRHPFLTLKAWLALFTLRRAKKGPRSLPALQEDIRLSCVILHHGSPESVELSLARLQKARGFDEKNGLEVVVVNNGPMDKAGEWTQVWPSWMRVAFYQIPNRGYAQGTNFALAQTHGRVLAILTDVLVEEDSLDTLLQKVEQASGQEFFVAPRLEYADGTIQDNFRRFPNLWDLAIKRTFLKHVFKERVRKYLMWDVDAKGEHEVDWLTGAFQMFSRALWEKVGEKDEDYFLFMSDIDLCEKARACGAKILFVGTVKAQHGEKRLSHGGIFDIVRSKMLRIHVRDAVLYFLKKLR